ncbi:MAG: hypothetical protein ABJH07_23045 [Sedimentitalea sp.]|uniref:hypothetical protein n=1 Tax=Sedimentitalea sp. TaxID=2048915 RepID=UPI003265F802
MKALKIIGLSIVGMVAAFVLHVRGLEVLSSLSTPSEMRAYPRLSQGVKSENYEIERLLYGSSEIWFDQQEHTYLIIADLIKDEQFEYSGHFVLRVGEDGHFIRQRRVTNVDPLPDVWEDSRYISLSPTPERLYVPTYSFGALKGHLELVKYQFTDFSEWPYFYYFFPVVPFDWKGVGYFNLTHQGETLYFQQSTDFYGGPLYATSNVDGQLYLTSRKDDQSGVAFLDVSESSYTRDMHGTETHREAYGLHVIRPRRN